MSIFNSPLISSKYVSGYNPDTSLQSAQYAVSVRGVKPIEEIGEAKRYKLKADYDFIVKVLGEPNATHLDDADKVKASWGFKDYKGRKGFIWCYKVDEPNKCELWSADGDFDLLSSIFAGKVTL